MARSPTRHIDSDALAAEPDKRGATVVISRHPARAQPLAIDLELCKWRHPIESSSYELQESKRIAARADTTGQSVTAMIHLAAAVIDSR